MSQLDRLESESMSGVPMRRKVPKPTAVEPSSTDIISQLANMFAASNEKLAVAIGGALTSTPKLPEPATTFVRRAVKMDFSYASDGSVSGCTTSDGVNVGRLLFTRSDEGISAATVSSAGSTWDIAFTRENGVIDSAVVSTGSNAGWNLAFTRANGHLSVSALPN